MTSDVVAKLCDGDLIVSAGVGLVELRFGDNYFSFNAEQQKSLFRALAEAATRATRKGVEARVKRAFGGAQ